LGEVESFPEGTNTLTLVEDLRRKNPARKRGEDPQKRAISSGGKEGATRFEEKLEKKAISSLRGGGYRKGA